MWHLVAPILLIFLRISWPQCMPWPDWGRWPDCPPPLGSATGFVLYCEWIAFLSAIQMELTPSADCFSATVSSGGVLLNGLLLLRLLELFKQRYLAFVSDLVGLVQAHFNAIAFYSVHEVMTLWNPADYFSDHPVHQVHTQSEFDVSKRHCWIMQRSLTGN